MYLIKYKASRENLVDLLEANFMGLNKPDTSIFCHILQINDIFQNHPPFNRRVSPLNDIHAPRSVVLVAPRFAFSYQRTHAKRRICDE